MNPPVWMLQQWLPADACHLIQLFKVEVKGKKQKAFSYSTAGGSEDCHAWDASYLFCQGSKRAPSTLQLSYRMTTENKWRKGWGVAKTYLENSVYLSTD